MPELRFAITQLQKSVPTRQHVWTIDSGINYTGSIGRRSLIQASVQTLSQTLLWMDDKASSPCLKTWGTHRSRHSKSMNTTSLNRSDIFILMIGTYLSLFKCLVRLTTQRILDSASRSRPMPKPGTQQIKIKTYLISKSAILSNNFVSLLSDL